MNDYEEVELICEVCGKKIKRVRRKSNKSRKFLCQRCGKKVIETG